MTVSFHVDTLTLALRADHPSDEQLQLKYKFLHFLWKLLGQIDDRNYYGLMRTHLHDEITRVEQTSVIRGVTLWPVKTE